MSHFIFQCSCNSPGQCSNYRRCERCQQAINLRGEASRRHLETPDVHRGPDIKASTCVPEFANVEPVEQAAAHREATKQMARAMPGVAKQHGKVHRTHRSQLPPLEASASTMSAHWRTTARTHWPTLEAVAASPEALSTVPAQQHPENPEQFTCTPVLTTTILSAEWPHGRNNGETMLDNTEKDAATGQERMPPHSENGFLPAQNITGGAPETLEDATAVFEATMDVFVKAVNSFRYDPMASFHRTATAHVQASRSRTSPDFADQRLARSTHRPLENGPIRARQYALGPSRDSHHLEQARPHDDAEQLVDAPSRDGGNPAEQQIPRPEGLRWKPGGKLNIQVAMGLDSSAASRHMYRHIVHSVHELATKAQINFSQTFREQEYDRLAKFYSVMRNKYDILRKYEDDWATKAILQQHLYYWRRKFKKEASLLGEVRHHDDMEQLAGAPSREGGNPTEQQIPRPKDLGQVRKSGHGLTIQQAMGLDSDAASRNIYKRIVYSVPELATKAQIDFGQTFSGQEYDRLAKFYSAMRNKHDILWKYEDDWATKFLLQRYMGRRRYSNSKKPTTEESLLGKGTAPATAARTDKGKDNAANAKQSFSSDDDSKKDDEEQLADTEYDIWLGF